MQIAVILSTYIFDIFIITTYLKNMLNGFKKNRKFLYCICILLTELLLFFNEKSIISGHSTCATLITTFISTATTLCLCLFFYGNLKTNLLTTLFFQTFASLSEVIFTFIISTLNPDILETKDTTALFSFMNIGSKIVLFILCLTASYILKKHRHSYPSDYNILLFTTPIISIIIFTFFPLKTLYTSSDLTSWMIVFICMIILNIVNYILIIKVNKNTLTQYYNKQMEQQLLFQRNKFEQLSESYRQSRRIIHDIKKQYFCIDEYISNKQYNKLKDFMKSAASDMESTYAKYNTGNLVIDSFLTNYENIATAHNISFTANLNVDFNKIPINDYDLCVILGNMLDNCINACSQDGMDKQYIKIIIETTAKQFIIKSENTVSYYNNKHENQNINHGYGLNNIKQTVEKNNGFFTYNFDKLFYVDIMIPIIEKKYEL